MWNSLLPMSSDTFVTYLPGRSALEILDATSIAGDKIKVLAFEEQVVALRPLAVIEMYNCGMFVSPQYLISSRPSQVFRPPCADAMPKAPNVLAEYLCEFLALPLAYRFRELPLNN
jgi:hypothetical protein